jgi:hypothetical protein
MSKNKPGRPDTAKAEAALDAAKVNADLDRASIAGQQNLETGLGEMSAEDRAAIMGAVADDVGADPSIVEHGPAGGAQMMTATEARDRLNEASAGPEEVSLGARLATLESRLDGIEKAMEHWASGLQQPAAAPAGHPPAPVRRATPDEEAAYCRANFEARSTGGTPFDGIQTWRDAGSPGLAA